MVPHVSLADPEGRLEVLISRLADRVGRLDLDRRGAFGEWLEDEKEGGRMTAPSEFLRRYIRERQEREEPGFSAYRIARDAKVSADAVQRFMSRKRGLTLDTFDAICTHLGLELTEAKRPRRGRTKATDETG